MIALYRTVLCCRGETKGSLLQNSLVLANTVLGLLYAATYPSAVTQYMLCDFYIRAVTPPGELTGCGRVHCAVYE